MMLLGRRRVGLVAMLAAGAVASGCGSDDEVSIADAKKSLVEDCTDGDKNDTKLCECIADELQAKGANAKKIDDLRKQVNDGKEPKEIGDAAIACGLKLGKQASGG